MKCISTLEAMSGRLDIQNTLDYPGVDLILIIANPVVLYTIEARFISVSNLSIKPALM